MIILSLDVSSVSTGWSVFNEDVLVGYGTIAFDHIKSIHARLVLFRDRLLELMVKYNPSVVLIEDVWFGKNAMTSKILAKFCGVAEEVSTRYVGKDPCIIVNKTIKGFFKCPTKKDIYKFILDIMELDTILNSYNKHNDITDAISMGIFYIHNNIKVIKQEKEYGYLYLI